MNDSQPHGTPAPEESTGATVEQLCDELEQAICSGRSADLGELLERLPEAARASGLEHLLQAEAAIRWPEQPSWDEYRGRFPAFQSVVDAVQAERDAAHSRDAAAAGSLHSSADLLLFLQEIGVDASERQRVVENACSSQAGVSAGRPELAAEGRLTQAQQTAIRAFLRSLRLPAAARSDESQESSRSAQDQGGVRPAEGAASIAPGGLFGDYEILSDLAKGGMGVVYRARQRSLNRIVALKMILAGRLAGPQEIQRFRAEAEAAASLQHPGIVPIYEVGQHDGQHFFSMGLVEGRSLSQRLGEGPLPHSDAAGLASKIAAAVGYANDMGVIHRDLKPGNILLDEQGEPHVTDFGLAKRVRGDAELTTTGQILGTPSYMPPEQALGEAESIDQRSDVYSLGAVLYATLAGRPPHQAASVLDTLKAVVETEPAALRTLDASIPRDLETICLKALAKDRRRRYQNARELKDDLDRFSANKPIRARRVGRLEKAWLGCRRNPLTASLTALVCLLAGLAVVGAAVYHSSLNAAHVAAVSRQYYTLLSQAGQRTVLRDGGRRWEALNDLRKAAAIPTPVRDPEELRSGFATWQLAFDARPQAAVAEGYQDYCIAYGPDGSSFAAGDEKSIAALTVRVYETRARRELAKLLLPPTFFGEAVGDGVRTLAYSGDGRLLAAGLRSGRVAVWETSTYSVAAKPWKAHGLSVTAIAFDPRDDQTLFTASEDATVAKWRIDGGGRLVRRLELPHPVTDASLHPERAELACALASRGLATIDLDAMVRSETAADGMGASKLCHSPNGRFLAVALDTRLVLVDPRDGSPIVEFEDPTIEAAHLAGIHRVAIERSGTILASSANDRKLKLWDLVSGHLCAEFVHGGGQIHPEFSPDGQSLACTAQDRTLIYEVGGLKFQRTIAMHRGQVRCFAVSPDGKRMACLARRRRMGANAELRELTLWDLPTTTRLRRLELSAETPVGAPVGLDIHPRDSRIAFLGWDEGPCVHVWNADKQGPPQRWPPENPRAIEFSPDGRRIWLASKGGTLFRIGPDAGRVESWDVRSQRRTSAWSNVLSGSLGSGNSNINCLSAGGKWICAGASDESVKLLRASDGALQDHWPCQSPVSSVALSADEAMAAVGTVTGRLVVFRLPDGERLLEIDAHRGPVTSCIWGDGMLASVSDDQTWRIWRHSRAGAFSRVLHGRVPEGRIQQARFSPEGDRMLVLIHGEPAVREWNLARLRTFWKRADIHW